MTGIQPNGNLAIRVVFERLAMPNFIPKHALDWCLSAACLDVQHI